MVLNTKPINERELADAIERTRCIALADLNNGKNLDKDLARCLENELYAEAEGIKRAVAEFKKARGL